MPTMAPVERLFCRSAPWRAVAERALLPWALHGAVPRGEVLEIGAGSGAMAAGLLHRFPGVRVTATDYDPAMVALAQRTLAPFGDRASARQADATALPFGDGSFDTVVSFLMLHHVLDWEGAIAEAARVLRPGGLLLGYDLLDGAVSRLVHRVDRSPFRLAPEGELRTALAPFASRAVLRNGPVARFAARTVAGSVQE